MRPVREPDADEAQHQANMFESVPDATEPPTARHGCGTTPRAGRPRGSLPPKSTSSRGTQKHGRRWTVRVGELSRTSARHAEEFLPFIAETRMPRVLPTRSKVWRVDPTVLVF